MHGLAVLIWNLDGRVVLLVVNICKSQVSWRSLVFESIVTAENFEFQRTFQTRNNGAKLLDPIGSFVRERKLSKANSEQSLSYYNT